MSDRLIEWNGKTYDVDPSELTMGEYEEIAKRGGPDGFREMLAGLREMKPAAWKALFWIQDWRTERETAWSAYMGPTYRVVLEGLDKLPAPPGPAEESGKAEEPSGIDGSEPSPTSTDTPQVSSTP